MIGPDDQGHRSEPAPRLLANLFTPEQGSKSRTNRCARFPGKEPRGFGAGSWIVWFLRQAEPRSKTRMRSSLWESEPVLLRGVRAGFWYIGFAATSLLLGGSSECRVVKAARPRRKETPGWGVGCEVTASAKCTYLRGYAYASRLPCYLRTSASPERAGAGGLGPVSVVRGRQVVFDGTSPATGVGVVGCWGAGDWHARPSRAHTHTSTYQQVPAHIPAHTSSTNTHTHAQQQPQCVCACVCVCACACACVSACACACACACAGPATSHATATREQLAYRVSSCAWRRPDVTDYQTVTRSAMHERRSIRPRLPTCTCDAPPRGPRYVWGG